mmetsp:Transcript_15501/g.45324  ORF Transcript_15501/g.45324 Transcript_15501/m.45324 type:complete len:154 (+) Transcript_15501:116-577(+)
MQTTPINSAQQMMYLCSRPVIDPAPSFDGCSKKSVVLAGFLLLLEEFEEVFWRGPLSRVIIEHAHEDFLVGFPEFPHFALLRSDLQPFPDGEHLFFVSSLERSVLLNFCGSANAIIVDVDREHDPFVKIFNADVFWEIVLFFINFKYYEVLAL